MDSNLKYTMEDETIDDLQLKGLNLIQKKYWQRVFICESLIFE